MSNKTVALTREADLGLGWNAWEWSDGSMTLGNTSKDKFIHLERVSVERLRSIINEAKAKAAA